LRTCGRTGVAFGRFNPRLLSRVAGSLCTRPTRRECRWGNSGKLTLLRCTGPAATHCLAAESRRGQGAGKRALLAFVRFGPLSADSELRIQIPLMDRRWATTTRRMLAIRNNHGCRR
jgi:hypothetical protein